jgi:hypothetical protein
MDDGMHFQESRIYMRDDGDDAGEYMAIVLRFYA